MQRLLEDLETKNPGTKTSMLAALRNVRPTHLLDATLWQKLNLPLVGDAPADEPAASATVSAERLFRA